MSKKEGLDWASDSRPSLPVASEHFRYIQMGGFAFTEWGITHDLSSEDVEALSHPPFSPTAG